MARFQEQFVQQVLQATDIVDFVGQYVSLKQRGREFVGLCPFHEDHKPSMYVSPAKQIYKCFACGAGGNALQFVMQYESMPFPEAVRTLASRANIPLPAETQQRGVEASSKRALVAACEFASNFFQRQLQAPAGRSALEYARSRGLSDESIERFGLGFAPDSWDAFLTAARKQGFSESVLVSAGLVRRRESGRGCYDYFRNRLMFPIHDLAAATVAFGGRALSEEERAKYLNSPETAAFDKSSMVYGLPFAREAIKREGRSVVVEGYLDVLLPIQAGVENVVATLGTALTDRHVRLLSRYAPEAVLVFDADVAGAAAAERGLELFLAQRLHVRVAQIPAGKDPCDYVLAEGPEALQTLVNTAPDALEYAWNRRYRDWQEVGDQPARKGKPVDEFLAMVASSAAYGAIDPVRQQHLAQHIAHILNIPALELQQRMHRMTRKTRAARLAAPAVSTVATSMDGASGNPQRELLEVLLDAPELFDDAAERIDPQDFTDPTLQLIAQRVWELGQKGRLTLEELMGREDMAELGGKLAELALAGQKRGNHQKTLHDAVAVLLDRREQDELRQLARTADDQENLKHLVERLQETHKRKHHGNRLPRMM